jgi:hypothetical protein
MPVLNGNLSETGNIQILCKPVVLGFCGFVRRSAVCGVQDVYGVKKLGGLPSNQCGHLYSCCKRMKEMVVQPSSGR